MQKKNFIEKNYGKPDRNITLRFGSNTISIGLLLTHVFEQSLTLLRRRQGSHVAL